MFGVRGLQGTDDEQIVYSQMLQNCVRFGTNVAIVSVRDDAWERFEATPASERSIALWWSDDRAGQLITLLGWLCQRHGDWEDASIVVYVPDNGDPNEQVRVEGVLHDARIRAEVRGVEPTPAAMSDALSGATLAFASLRVRRGAAMGPFDTPLRMLVESLPIAVMILATELVDLDAEADDENIAQIEAVTEQVDAARKRAELLDAEAASLLVKAEALRLELEPSSLADAGAAERQEREQILEETATAASAAYRNYVDARSRCVALESRLAELAPSGVGSQFNSDIWRSSSSNSP